MIENEDLLKRNKLFISEDTKNVIESSKRLDIAPSPLFDGPSN